MYEFDKAFSLLQSRLLKEVDGFLHDFAITDNYYVFFSVSFFLLLPLLLLLRFFFLFVVRVVLVVLVVLAVLVAFVFLVVLVILDLVLFLCFFSSLRLLSFLRHSEARLLYQINTPIFCIMVFHAYIQLCFFSFMQDILQELQVPPPPPAMRGRERPPETLPDCFVCPSFIACVCLRVSLRLSFSLSLLLSFSPYLCPSLPLSLLLSLALPLFLGAFLSRPWD